MKKLILILLSALLVLPTACVKDDLDACAGLLHLYFSYIYRETNEFYSTVSTDVHVNYYYKESGERYRESTVERASIDINTPYLWEKTLQDRDSVTLVSWTHDERVDYVEPSGTPQGEGYVHLKEITEGSGICLPVDDLLYGTVSFDAGMRTQRNDVTIPFVRAVCRVRITMIPETVQDGSGDITVNGGSGTRADIGIDGNGGTGSVVVPHAGDYTFHLEGTRNKIDYNNITSGEAITLAPKAYYDEKTGNVTTNWFGAFSSLEEYLNVNVFIKTDQVAKFDCAPIQLASTPGDYIDLVIDGRYTRPVLSVKVNGWRLATVESSM